MKDNYEKYEEMSVGSGDAPNPNYFIKNKKFRTPVNKRKISFIILLLLIIILGIFFIIKSSYVSSLSEQNNELKNEIKLLSIKEDKLKNDNNKLFSKKDSLYKHNNNLIQQINDIEVKNKKLKENNNEMLKGISEKQEIIKDYENKINNSKNKLINFINKESNVREKIKECINQIQFLELKIQDLEKKNISNINDKDLKKEEKKKNKRNEKNNVHGIADNLTSRINSKILYKSNHLNLLDKWFEKELKYKLLFRASEDGYSPKVFHNKVDKFKNNLILIKDVNNFIYGGFTRNTWDGNKIYKKDKNAIVFNLDNEIYYKIKDNSYSIFCDPDNLAIFGDGDIYLGVEGIKSFFPKSYGNSLENKENELTLGYKKLIPLEIEVFQLS